MGSSTSSYSNLAVNVKDTIKNLSLDYTKNDNYVNNTIKNAFISAVNVAVSMQSIMQSENAQTIKSEIENKMNVSNVKITGEGNSFKVGQFNNAEQYITALAFVTAINNQDTQTEALAIASDILNATQGAELLADQSSKLSSVASTDEDISAVIDTLQSATAGSLSGGSSDVSRSKESVDVVVDQYNEAYNFEVSENVVSLLQDYCTQMQDNVSNGNEYFLNAKQNLEALVTAVNDMNVSGVEIEGINNSFEVVQANNQIQSIYSKLESFYNNIMSDKLYHYYEDTIVQSGDQTARASTSQSVYLDQASAADVKVTAEESTEQTAESTGIIQDLGSALTGMLDSVSGPVAAIVCVFIIVVGAVVMAILLALTKTLDRAVGAVTDISKDPGVQEMVKSVANTAIENGALASF